MAQRPIQEVFMRRARGVGHILRDRVWRMTGFESGEPLRVELTSENGKTRLRFYRVKDGHGCIEFDNITPAGVADVRFGEETTLSSEQIDAQEEIIDNSHGAVPISKTYEANFAHGQSSETQKSAGTSVTVSVSASEGVEGIAEFQESIETEAHAEFSETKGEESSVGRTSSYSIEVPPGKKIKVCSTRTIAKKQVKVTAHGKFTHTVAVGKHSGGHFVGGHNKGYGRWDSWDNFVDVINRHAPDNWDLATSFKQKHAWHADLWALDALESDVAYEVTYDDVTNEELRQEEL